MLEKARIARVCARKFSSNEQWTSVQAPLGWKCANNILSYNQGCKAVSIKFKLVEKCLLFRLKAVSKINVFSFLPEAKAVVNAKLITIMLKLECAVQY